MTILLKYARTDGRIQGMWESIVPDLLAAQMVADDPVSAFVMVETDLSPRDLQLDHFVQDETLVAKTVLTLTATPNPFTADGTTVCTVTVAPFVACTLLVDGTPVALTEADPDVELTSDVPHVFQVVLVPMTAYRADPMTVEAT